MNYDHNKKFGLLKCYSGYGKINLNSPKGYSLKIINAQTVLQQAAIIVKIHRSCSEECLKETEDSCGPSWGNFTPL